MTTETLQFLLSIGGLLIAAVGLPLLYLQLRDVQRSLRSQAHAGMYQQGADMRSHLVDHPHLRKYFFDKVEITREHEDYARVVTIAELFLNYLENIAVLGDSFGTENRPALKRFVRSALDNSPILRTHLAANRTSYNEALQHYIR